MRLIKLAWSIGKRFFHPDGHGRGKDCFSSKWMSNLITLPTNMHKIKTWEMWSKKKDVISNIPEWRQRPVLLLQYLNQYFWIAMILSKPSSKVNSIALLAASVSTSMTDGGNGTSCDREAITSPSWLRITTPTQTLFSFSMMALSKLTLCPFEVGGDHSVPVRELGLQVKAMSLVTDVSHAPTTCQEARLAFQAVNYSGDSRGPRWPKKITQVLCFLRR